MCDQLASDMSLSPGKDTSSECCHALAPDDLADVLAPDVRLVLASECANVVMRVGWTHHEREELMSMAMQRTSRINTVASR